VVRLHLMLMHQLSDSEIRRERMGQSAAMIVRENQRRLTSFKISSIMETKRRRNGHAQYQEF